MEKKLLRRQALSARAALTPAQRREKSEMIYHKLKAILPPAPAIILSYCATPEEVNLDAIEGTALPRVTAQGQMEACFPGREWVLDRYGIRTPGRDASPVSPEEIALVLVPLVGFDRQCNRLGHGGGYYDRYLPRCKNARLLGIAFSVQELPRVPTQPHDFPLHGILTENGLIDPVEFF